MFRATHTCVCKIFDYFREPLYSSILPFSPLNKIISRSLPMAVVPKSRLSLSKCKVGHMMHPLQDKKKRRIVKGNIVFRPVPSLIHRSYDVLDMQAEHLEALFHHEIDPLDEIALAIRRKRQIERFMLVWL